MSIYKHKKQNKCDESRKRPYDHTNVWPYVVSRGKFPFEGSFYEEKKLLFRVEKETKRVKSQVKRKQNDSFNPLSLKSIMNSEGAYESEEEASKICNQPQKKIQRVLQCSDYSRHEMIRSGRWTFEEENYAKAMIEAFETGLLPLDKSVSIRNFLSEILVCHPMRISKKFVGYVRKYQCYGLALTHKNQAQMGLQQSVFYKLAELEKRFWKALQEQEINDCVLNST